MTFHYDHEADALEITFDDAGIVSRTVEIDLGTLVDVDEHGDIVAIEVIRPMRRWPLNEIFERFAIGAEDATMLRSLWADEKPYPFAEPLALA